MDERGSGYLVDLLVFSMLVSIAIAALAAANPVDPGIDRRRYASSFAQSTLLSMQRCTADQFGGLSYRLELPVANPILPSGESAGRKLPHKALANLLAEDALLNSRLWVMGTEIPISRINRGMDDELQSFLKSILDELMGGRFGYRLCVRWKPIDLGQAWVDFEMEIENFEPIEQLCLETMMLSMPMSTDELAGLFRKNFGMSVLPDSVDPIMEVSLELWST